MFPLFSIAPSPPPLGTDHCLSEVQIINIKLAKFRGGGGVDHHYPVVVLRVKFSLLSFTGLPRRKTTELRQCCHAKKPGSTTPLLGRRCVSKTLSQGSGCLFHHTHPKLAAFAGLRPLMFLSRGIWPSDSAFGGLLTHLPAAAGTVQLGRQAPLGALSPACMFQTALKLGKLSEAALSGPANLPRMRNFKVSLYHVTYTCFLHHE